jgi:hypothetical protein
VQRVDGFYLYQVGYQIHPLSELRHVDSPIGKATTLEEARFPIYIAESALEALLTRSVFRLRTSNQPGYALLAAIRELKRKLEEADTAKDAARLASNIDWIDMFSITSALTAFEAVLGAELSLLHLYIVTQKAGFDTSVLIESGAHCFPADILFKVPEALSDLQQATKCLAFEVFTAAGFHLHRVNEAVLHRYWDAVTNGASRPNSRNMGDYLNAMGQRKVGDEKVKAAIRNLKDFHRNPLIHPEHSIDTADQAIALMNGVHTVVVQMLAEIPIANPPATQLTGGLAAMFANTALQLPSIEDS